MKKFLHIFLVGMIIAAFGATGCGKGQNAQSSQKEYYQIVVLSDTHIPGNIFAHKEKALATINSWPDVDLVAVTGDIVSKGGDATEYAAAQRFFANLGKPKAMVGGNHDYIYPDSYPVNKATGHHEKESSPELRRQKLERFKQTWGLQEIFYSKRAANYLLVFLTPDDLVTNNYSQMTDRQLDWLRGELQKNKGAPTIIFFHAPLQGTYASEKILKSKSPDSYNAEPAEKIRQILLQNPQVFIWVAGHLHIAPTNRDFKSTINLYQNQVMVIHNTDMNGDSVFNEADMKSTKHDIIWTNSLFLYPDRVVVKTYDHKQGAWLGQLERVIVPPKP
jgi:3',5'-cyclic-AMP phosphodiesterase